MLPTETYLRKKKYRKRRKIPKSLLLQSKDNEDSNLTKQLKQFSKVLNRTPRLRQRNSSVSSLVDSYISDSSGLSSTSALSSDSEETNVQADISAEENSDHSSRSEKTLSSSVTLNSPSSLESFQSIRNSSNQTLIQESRFSETLINQPVPKTTKLSNTPNLVDETAIQQKDTMKTQNSNATKTGPDSSKVRALSAKEKTDSVVSRQCIPSRKDSLLSRHAGSEDDRDILYGKSDDENIEQTMLPSTKEKLLPTVRPPSRTLSNTFTVRKSISNLNTTPVIPPIMVSPTLETSDAARTPPSKDVDQASNDHSSTRLNDFGSSDEELRRVMNQDDVSVYDPIGSLPEIEKEIRKDADHKRRQELQEITIAEEVKQSSTENPLSEGIVQEGQTKIDKYGNEKTITAITENTIDEDTRKIILAEKLVATNSPTQQAEITSSKTLLNSSNFASNEKHLEVISETKLKNKNVDNVGAREKEQKDMPVNEDLLLNSSKEKTAQRKDENVLEDHHNYESNTNENQNIWTKTYLPEFLIKNKEKESADLNTFCDEDEPSTHENYMSERNSEQSTKKKNKEVENSTSLKDEYSVSGNKTGSNARYSSKYEPEHLLKVRGAVTGTSSTPLRSLPWRSKASLTSSLCSPFIEPDKVGKVKKPKWHPPWQLKQEILAHSDGIPVLVIDPSNRWFVTGSSDKTIRLWDINTCEHKLVIKRHKQGIRALTFGAMGHRDLYSTAEDRQLYCHNVEINKITSKFKTQGNIIYSMCVYQPLNLLLCGGRDKTVKLYDTRTAKLVRSLRGHQNTVSCIVENERTQQVITGSHDGTLRIWDVREGKCTNILQGHHKSVRVIEKYPDQNILLSASNERILSWDLPSGNQMQEIEAGDMAINSVTINRFGVTVAGGSNGGIHLWDYNSGHLFQKISKSKVYKSQEIPICLFTSKFDHTGTKLICSDASNVVKIYSEAYSRVQSHQVNHNYVHSNLTAGESPQTLR